jgi:hypothetical protein
LIDLEIRASDAVHIARLQLLDAIVDLAALAADRFVNPRQTLFHIGDHEARIDASRVTSLNWIKHCTDSVRPDCDLAPHPGQTHLNFRADGAGSHCPNRL